MGKPRDPTRDRRFRKQVERAPLTEVEIAWLAGLLEGEGCFHVRSDDGRPMIKLGMTDRDVIERAARLMGGTYSFRERAQPHHKDQYVVYLTTDAAQRVMWMVLPHMGERRTRAILKAVGTPPPTLFA